jgi:hypothetical protein
MRVAAVVFLAIVAAPPARATLPEVDYAGDRVTAHFQGVPVGDALAAVARAVGAEIRGSIAAPHDVSLELTAVPLGEALARLLGEQNFTVRYGDGGRVKTIELRGGVQARGAPPTHSPAAGVPTEPAKPTFPIVLAKMFDRHRPLDLPDALAERFGTHTLGMPKLLEIAVADDDGISRALASNLVLTTLERESLYRRSFLRSLHRLDAEDLDAIASGPSGERFQELLEFLAAHSREPTLQKKAGVILDQVRDARDDTGS